MPETIAPEQPPKGLRYSERKLYAECPQARQALQRLARIRDEHMTYEVALIDIAQGRCRDPQKMAKVAIRWIEREDPRS